MSQCIACGKPLENDEIAITKKLVNRGATEFYCRKCLAERFKISVEEIDRLIEHFRQAGCSLFT